jgi:hypothetical protein
MLAVTSLLLKNISVRRAIAPLMSLMLIPLHNPGHSRNAWKSVWCKRTGFKTPAMRNRVRQEILQASKQVEGEAKFYEKHSFSNKSRQE